jgi:lysophospholipase
MLSPAPLMNDLARGPEGGSGHWVHTEDGLRLRLGLWPNGSKGTVLIFPGRTEYIEKYGGAAAALAEAGYRLFGHRLARTRPVRPAAVRSPDWACAQIF